MRELIRLGQLPEPKTNVRINGVEVDFYWPELGVVIEVQSHKYHLTRPALERDTRKAARLTAAGKTVSYVTWLQMEHEPFAVVARVAQTLTRAEEVIRLRSTPIPSISSSTSSPACSQRPSPCSRMQPRPTVPEPITSPAAQPRACCAPPRPAAASQL